MHDPAVESETDQELGARIRAVAQAINGIAHGLAGPMQAMTNVLFSMSRRESPPESLQSLNEHHESLAKELQHLLVLARAHKPASQTTCAAAHLAERALSPLSDRERGRLTVESSGPEVRIEAERWAEAVHELVRNALDHAAAGSRAKLVVRTGEGTVSARVEGGDPERWPDTVLRRAIDPLVTTKPRALGVGLATAFAFAAERGGRLELRVANGNSVVVLEVPMGASS